MVDTIALSLEHKATTQLLSQIVREHPLSSVAVLQS